MKHDKLLAEIELRQGMELGLHAFKAWLALRAVVVLHRPIGKYCQRCSVNDWGQEQQKYPCETIQAIEKELK